MVDKDSLSAQNISSPDQATPLLSVASGELVREMEIFGLSAHLAQAGPNPAAGPILRKLVTFYDSNLPAYGGGFKHIE